MVEWQCAARFSNQEKSNGPTEQGSKTQKLTDLSESAHGRMPREGLRESLQEGEYMNDSQEGALRLESPTNRKAGLALAALGFGLCRAWIVACLAIPMVHGTVYGTNWLYLIMGALAALFVAFATHTAVGKSERFREHVAEATFGLILASALVIPASLMLDSLLLAFVGFMAGYIAFPLCSFLLLTMECKRNRISWRTGRSLDEIDPPAEPYAEPGEDAPKPDTALSSERKHLVGKLMASVAIFSFLVRMFDSIPTSGIDPFLAFGGSSLFALVVVGFAFTAAPLLLKEKFDVTQTYRVAVPIMVLGCAVLALFFEVNSAIAILLIGVGYEFFDVLVWILFADMSRTHRDGAGYIYGLGVAATFSGMAAGVLAGELAHTLITSGAVQLAVIAMASIISLVFTGFMLFPEGMMSKLSPLRPNAKKQKNEREARRSEREGFGRRRRIARKVARGALLRHRFATRAHPARGRGFDSACERTHRSRYCTRPADS